jgi:hypothetical protein
MFFILALCTVKTKAEFGLDSYAIGGGLTVVKIMNDNPATYSMVDSLVVGGALNGAQSGFELRATFDLDTNSRIKFPVGISYYLYDGKERVPVSKFYDIKHHHQVDILFPYIGIQYSFVKVPGGLAEIYGGIDFTASYIFNSTYTRYEIHKTDPSRSSTKAYNFKENTTRFGLNTKIGIMGKLQDNIEINVSGGFNFQNLFNKDNKRGQLLTPSSFSEFEESPVNNFIFSLLLQYRF